MTTELKKIVFGIILILCLASVMYADWYEGEPYKMHFPQLPDFYGWDICLMDQALADDFQCIQSGPITDIHFWISYRWDETIPIEYWDIYIASDVNGMPGTLLWMWDGSSGNLQIIPYGSGPQGWFCPTLGEYEPMNHFMFWQVNLTGITNPLIQQQGQIYWLIIQARSPSQPPGPGVGWKSSFNFFGAPALWWNSSGGGWQPIPVIAPTSLAFVITGGPNEPNYPTNAKWLQRPDLTTNGVDVNALKPSILADDFECNKTTKITDITVWGSWAGDTLPPGGPNNVWFTLSIHSDIPAGPNTYSRPGPTLWYKNLMPSEVSIEAQDINEGWWDPYYDTYIFPADHICWKYVFHIPEANAFCQQGEPNKPIVYWLDVQADPNDPTHQAKFGWKTSINHWNDDAVWTSGSEPYMGWWYELRYPPQHPSYPNSVDLAFAIDGNIPCVQPAQHDLGDAPDSSNNFGAIMTAYPSGVVANYPTVYLTGSPPFGPIHQQPQAVAWLGPGVSLENEADLLPDNDLLTNIDPPANSPNRDVNDDGVLGIPLKLPYCYSTTFKYQVNAVRTDVNLYVNVWFDWNRDGDWDDTFSCGTNTAPEWAVQNQFLGPGSLVVGLNTKTTPQFRAWHPSPTPQDMNTWMRITLSEQPWVSTGSGGSGPATGYLYGETEDYYFPQITKCLKPNIADMNEYNTWVWFGEPNCWCCKRQCRGDADCKKQGLYWVASNDLNLLKIAMTKTDTVLKSITNGICADFDHKKQGLYRVATNDLNTLKAYMTKTETRVPCCDKNQDCIIDCNMPPVGDRWYFWTN